VTMLRRKIILLSVLLAPAASAQEVALPEPVAAPTTGKEGEPEIALDVDREIDLANVVTSAAKGVTTVQEAPSIITIITADEIKSRGFRELLQALGTVPGWMDINALGNQTPNPLVRGMPQAALLLQDGISMFDPYSNVATFGRIQAMERIKRLEVVTGPGGVLWGANSFLGIVNIISKDAEDVNGLEVSAGYGDGPGNVEDIRAYAMFGRVFLKGKLKLFQHVSYENWVGQTNEIPQYIVSSPAPQPNGPAVYGPVTGTWPQRSWNLTVDGKYTFGPLSLYYNIPFGDTHSQLVFSNQNVGGTGKFTTFDRYVIAEYKDRFFKDRFGLTVKGYWSELVRQIQVQLFPPNHLTPAFVDANGNQHFGLHFDIDGQFVQRGGGTVDTDINLPYGIRILLGGELFYEGINASLSTFSAPEKATDLPLYCPVDASNKPINACPRQFIYDTGRIVGALYVSAQWRPFTNKLTLDGGVRLQKGWGDLPYDLTPLYSAAVVWNFLPDYHLKANYTTGFRPPVFQDTQAAPGGVSFGASPTLKNEHSQSFQGEINARLLKNVRKVRELELRVDYSYTFLQDVIQIHGGIYGNTGSRAIHSVEVYSKLYLNGDHFLQASYTYLYAATTDLGVARNTPNHWFAVGASFNLVKNILDVNANLSVFGAYEDPDRYAHYPNATQPGIDDVHTIVDPTTGKMVSGPGRVANVTDLTFDHLSPVALLQLGVRLRVWKEHFTLNAQFYNVLNQHYFYPDIFYDLTPSVEMTPTPAPGFNFFTSITYHP
jgi:iron complex outermembrane receptor protein